MLFAVPVFLGAILPKSWLDRHRANKAAAEFNRMTQAYDDAIEAARRKHRSTRALEQAKRDYVHALLRGEVGA